MMKANTGSSVNSDPRAAGREAAKKAAKGLKDPKIIFAYAASGYYEDLPEVVNGIRETLPGVPIIGSTTWHGVVLPEGFVGGKYFVGAMALADPKLTVGIGAAARNGHAENARESGRKAALAAMKMAGRKDPPDYFYMSAMPGFEEFYLKGITEVIGRRPMFGGSAVDELIIGDWNIFTGDGVTGYGVAVAFFYADKTMVNHFTSAPYYELDEKSVVTKMDSPRRLAAVEGDSLPARVCKRADVDPELTDGPDLQQICIQDPVGVKDRLGDLTTLIFPMYLRPDGSIDMGANMAEGTVAIHMRGEVADMVKASGKELEKLARKMDGKAAAYHMSMGFGRGMVMLDEGKMDKVVKNIQKAADGRPFILAFTLSECGFVDDGMNTCGNLMISYTGFPK